MVVRDHPALSLSRQCRLLSIGRSSLYYEPKGESAETLALMRRIDELFLKYPFYGARRMTLHLRREGVRIGRRRAGRLMRLMGLQAIYRAPRTSAPHPEHRVYPYLLRGLAIERANHVWCARYHLHPGAARLPLPGGDHGLGEPVRPGLAAVEHAGRKLLHRRARRGPDPAWRAGDLQHRPGQPVSPASPSPGACRRPASGSRWMAGAGAWTTSSSNGCGARSNTRRSTCHEIADGYAARCLIREWVRFYNVERPHLALDGRTPAEAYRGEPPVDMMDKPLRALPTSPQAQQQQQENQFKGILAA